MKLEKLEITHAADVVNKFVDAFCEELKSTVDIEFACLRSGSYYDKTKVIHNNSTNSICIIQ